MPVANTNRSSRTAWSAAENFGVSMARWRTDAIRNLMPVVHELTTFEIKVFSNASVYAALETHLPAAGGKLLGTFATDIGELSRVLVLRGFESADALAEARLRLLMADNPLGVDEWLVKLQ